MTPPAQDSQAQRKQKMGWYVSVAFFCVVFWAPPPLLGAIGSFLREHGVPSELIFVSAVPLAVVLFFWVAKWFTVARMPKYLPHQFFARELLFPGEPLQPLAVPAPIPSPGQGPASALPYDWQAFARLGHDLQALGFVPLSAWKRLDPNGVVDTVWGDTWRSPDGRCLATISQTLPLGAAPWPVIVAFVAYFENGRTLAVSNRKPYAMAWLFRHPRHAWLMRPAMFPEELLNLWQAEAQAQSLLWSTALRCAPASPVEIETEMEQQYAAFRLSVARKNVILGLAEGFAGQFKAHSEWRGQSTAH